MPNPTSPKLLAFWPRVRQGLGHFDRAVLMYVGLFTGWLVLRFLFFDRFWLLALMNFMAEYYFVPLPFLALWVILRRRWRPVPASRWQVPLIPLLLPTFTFGLMFGDFFLPSLAPVSSAGPGFTAMAFNILWENQDYAAIGVAVRAGAPDIVGFEELRPDNYPGLVAQLQADYPYYAPPPPDPSGGVGLFSRYPIEMTEPFPLPPRNLTLHAIVNISGQRVHVFVVHLSANNMAGYPLDQFIPLAQERNASRLSETAGLKALIEPIHEPLILLCDCNLSDTSQAYQTLQSFLVDSYREAGWGFGHTLNVPNIPFPVQRIDYVWHNASLAAVEAHVGIEGGSDHLPIVSKLVFTSPQ